MADIYKDAKTDERGVIIYANALFCDISRLYAQRAAFKGLWDDVKAKFFWIWFVVNRRKNMGYY